MRILEIQINADRDPKRCKFKWSDTVLCVFRVATFNDCEEAAAELQKQISEAREDLRSKGFKFD